MLELYKKKAENEYYSRDIFVAKMNQNTAALLFNFQSWNWHIVTLSLKLNFNYYPT